VRALFVADWDLEEPRRAFGDRAAMTAEVHELRRDHNSSPDDAIEAVAIALRGQVEEAKPDRALERLPPGAVAYWAVPRPDADARR